MLLSLLPPDHPTSQSPLKCVHTPVHNLYLFCFGPPEAAVNRVVKDRGEREGDREGRGQRGSEGKDRQGERERGGRQRGKGGEGRRESEREGGGRRETGAG